MANPTYKDVNADVLSIMEKTGRAYYLLLLFFAGGAGTFFFLPWAYQIFVGQGVTGLRIPNVWGVYLVNFVFWVGIAHAGTLISAMLFITKTPWRRSIARSAETMTLFALIIVSLFVFIHMGRPWNVYWTMPYPNQRQLWLNFLSPLMFDVIAIGTYFTSSVIFFSFGLIPDLGTLKHGAKGLRKQAYEILSLGWRGTDREWSNHAKGTMFFAAFIMPLVVSVHSIVSWDFALSIVPGYMQTIFAPYFVTGALLSGFSAVILMLTLMRLSFPVMKKYVTKYHYDRIGQFMLVLSLAWTYCTSMEILTGLYADTSFELESIIYKTFAPPHGYLFAFMILCNSILPLVLLSRKIRETAPAMFLLSIFVLMGMWLERYLIVPNALSRKLMPWMWKDYIPSWVEVSISVGALMFFISMFLVFIKVFPILSLFELKEDIGIPMEKEG